MSDDETPIVDLQVYRSSRQPKSAPTRARLVSDQLQISHDDGRTWVAFGEAGVEWLSSWIRQYRSERHNTRRVNEHRCRTCSYVVGIECRGHRDQERRVHYQVAVLERRKRWVFVSGSVVLEGWMSEATRPAPNAKLEEFVSAAKGACGRRVSGSSTSSKWDDVDCATCLKRKPRMVP